MANNVLQIKRTSVSGRAANTTTLTNPGELALNMTDGIMYSTNGSVVFQIGANLTSIAVGNTTARFTANTLGAYHTGTVNATSLTVGSSFIANTTGAYHTGTVNAASHTVGTSFVANTSRVVIGTAVGLQANGGIGTAGQVLHSNGTTAYWAADDQGVTSLVAANGLNGGTITSTGTISVLGGSTLTVNTTGAHVNSALSIASINAASHTVGTNFVANSTQTTFGTPVLLNNGQQVRFQTTNTSAYVYFTQQNDDNFVFYSSNTTYGARAVWAIFGNSITSNLQTLVPFQPTAGFVANSSLGSAGQVLKSSGSGVYWDTAGGTGTVTSVATANGLSGGTITTTGTLGVVTGPTLTVNSTGIHVNTIATSQLTGDVALGANTSGNYVATITNANGISGSSSAEGGAPTIGVVTGSTLTVNTTGIHVNSALSIASLALSGDITVSGNLTVSGTRTYVNTTTLDVGDNIITLNADLGAAAPSQNAGIEIMRGTSANVQFLWDETNDRWSTNGQPMAVSSLVAAGAASGITTLAAGNTTITGFVNASASVNSALLTVGTSFVANTTVTTIADTTGLSGSTQPLAVKNGSYVLGVVPRSGSGAYNNLVTLDDTTIVVTGASIGNANLAIVPWSGASGGFRMATVANSTTFSIVGNTTVTGFANVTSTLQVGGVATFAANANFDSGVLFVDGTNNRVGVNTTTPGEALDVTGNIRASQSITVGSGGTYAAGTIYSNADWGMIFRAKQASPAQAEFLWTNSADTQLMRLFSNGNLGIANTAATHKLSVNGTGYFGDDLTVNGGQVYTGTVQDRVKYGVWTDSQYGMGFQSGYTYGGLENDYAISFQMNDLASRGFWWGDTGHSNAQGAMALTTDGKLTVAHSAKIGFGESDTSIPGSTYALEVNGAFAATTKSFLIDHPTKPGMKLRYGSLEGPENGVYVRGRLKDSNTIELPDYWTGLVDADTITVNLTAIGKSQDLWVEDIVGNKVIVGGENINCFYTVFAERKDVDKLEVEF